MSDRRMPQPVIVGTWQWRGTCELRLQHLGMGDRSVALLAKRCHGSLTLGDGKKIICLRKHARDREKKI